MRNQTLLLVVAVVALAGCGQTPSAAIVVPPTGDIFVRVVDEEHRPLGGAMVWVEGNATRHESDRNGTVRLVGLPPGKHVVHGNHTGYWDNETEFEIVTNATTEAWLVLEELPGPEDHWAFGDDRLVCALAMPADDSSPEPYCLDMPVKGPGSSGPAASLSHGAHLYRATLQFVWEPETEAARHLAFDISRAEGAFADGRTILRVKGESPLQLKLAEEVASAEIRGSPGKLVVLVRPVSFELPEVVHSQGVDVQVSLQHRTWPNLSQG